MSAPVTIPATLAEDLLDVVHRDARRARKAAARAGARALAAEALVANGGRREAAYDLDDAQAEAARLDRQAERLAALAAALTAAIAEPAASVEALTH